MPTSLKRTHIKAQKIAEMIASEEAFSKASMTLLWAYLFNRIHKAVTDQDYETLISLSQKLSTTTGNLHNLYQKLKEKAEATPFPQLSGDELEEIEKKLKLL